MLPTIEYLKENNTGIYYFGLGFIQVKMGDDVRYNFYHPELTPKFVEGEEIHTHPYDFKSEILKGCLEEDLFDIVPRSSGRWDFCKIDCKGNNEKLFPCDVALSTVFFHLEGEVYERDYATLHSVSVTEPTITKFTKGERYGKAFAIMPKDQEECTPFIHDRHPQVCWDIVEEILKC